MGLYRRKDSDVWWMSFTAHGRNYRKSTETTDKELARRVLRSIEGKIAEGKWFPQAQEQLKNYVLSELAQKYLEWAEGRQKSARWKGFMIKQLVDEFGKVPLRQFNTQLVEQFQSKRLRRGIKKVQIGKDQWAYPPNKPATINRMLAVLSHMFTKAVDWKMMPKDVAAGINAKMLPENNRRLRFLSKEECQALIHACDPHLKPIVITALNTGMRRGEILTLRWDQHVDLKHNFILLDNTKNGERREIPVNKTLCAVLQGLPRRIDIPYVFFDPATGKPYKEFKRSFGSACRRAGIRDFRPHDLRHTFASQLVMAGVDLTTVKELLGHKEIRMTLRYAHLAASHKAAAVDVLDRTLTGHFHVFFTSEEQKKISNSVTH